MTEAGLVLDLFEDNVDITTHFLGDYGLVAGGWVRLQRGRYEVCSPSLPLSLLSPAPLV